MRYRGRCAIVGRLTGVRGIGVPFLRDGVLLKGVGEVEMTWSVLVTCSTD